MTPLTPGLVPLKYHESLLALRSLDYIPDMVLVDSHGNPHRADLSLWHYVPDVYMDLLICVAWTHQLVRCHSTHHITFHNCLNQAKTSVTVKRSHLPSIPDPTVRKIYKRMHSSIKMLNELLDDVEMRFSDIVLSIIITLMRVEVQQSAFGSWPAHLLAARIIVKRRGGFAQVLNGDQGYLGRSYITGDVMSSVFSPRSMLERDATISQLEYIPLLESFYQDGRETDFPCPNQIVEALIQINNARLLTRNQDNSTSECHSRSQILELIASFDPKLWAHEQLHKLQYSSTTHSSTETLLLDLALGGEVVPIGSVLMRDELHLSCTEIARAFQLATMLYCLRTLYIDQSDSSATAFAPHLKPQTPYEPGTSASCIHQITLHNLLQSLRSLWVTDASSRAFMGKLTLWPLWTAGLELDLYYGFTAFTDEREFITTSLQKLCTILGGFAPLDALSALNLIWENTGTNNTLGTWDEKVMMPEMRGMFFF
ncbi:hypothetical protein NLG97_g3402 [Lecanicillium saksenae]|uniref:Uncharacterized protein n=1 Tax=Lecanicillium saksenae TaxID=468837 RepID=A0ACC1QY66_9HYPO|nr:hypothetical protein NLG97_g3402 [Lecanicillium saksenae]